MPKKRTKLIEIISRLCKLPKKNAANAFEFVGEALGTAVGIADDEADAIFLNAVEINKDRTESKTFRKTSEEAAKAAPEGKHQEAAEIIQAGLLIMLMILAVDQKKPVPPADQKTFDALLQGLASRGGEAKEAASLLKAAQIIGLSLKKAKPKKVLQHLEAA